MTRERKMILIVGTVLLMAGAVYRFVPVIGTLMPNGELKDIKLQKVIKYRQKIESERQLREKAERLSRTLDRDRQIYLEGATPALAAVFIQNVINDIAYDNELVIDSLTVNKAKPLEDVEGIVEVSVAVKLKPTIRQLLNLLYSLDSAPQLLSVTAMQLRRLARDNVLNAYLTISGYMPDPAAEN